MENIDKLKLPQRRFDVDQILIYKSLVPSREIEKVNHSLASSNTNLVLFFGNVCNVF